MKYSDINHFQSLYKNINPDFGFNAKTTEEFTIWQDRFRSRLREVLGLDRMQENFQEFHPIAHQVDEEDTGEFIRQRWVLHVEPTVPLPFILLKPRLISGSTAIGIDPAWAFKEHGDVRRDCDKPGGRAIHAGRGSRYRRASCS